jgi:hypothetical protein
MGNLGISFMLFRKKKKNKFHLPAEEPEPESASASMSSALDPHQGYAYYEQNESDDEPTNEEVEGIPDHVLAEANRYRLLIVKGPQPEEVPQRTWEIYYRNRSYANTVGDPLLKVVEADSKEEAEYKTLYMDPGTKGGVVAINATPPDGDQAKSKKESAFAFPTAHPAAPAEPNYKSTYQKPKSFRPQ